MDFQKSSQEPSAPFPTFSNIGNQPPPYELLNSNYDEKPINMTPTQTIINMPAQTTSNVIYVGGCPSCRVGVLRESHCTFCGILWSILLFPIGLLCLCCCTKSRCSNCSYSH